MNFEHLNLKPESKPRLIAVVDTEEEFDWSKPFSREATSVSHIQGIHRLQEVYELFSVQPVYVVDYPVASQSAAWRPLRDLMEQERASIGAHLHPWVTPPYREKLSPSNSYGGNLSRDLEYAKLAHLTEQIERSFDFRPTVFKAGRYGIGPNTLNSLAALGYEVDLSPSPPLDCSEDGGPDFSRMSHEPYLDSATGLLVIPGTGAHHGWLRGDLVAIRRWCTSSWRTKFHVNSLLCRSGALERSWLSPESFSSSKMITLTKAMLKQGSRFFVVSLHSSIIMPGATPYAKDEKVVAMLIDRLHDYFTFFFEELGGEPWTPLAAREHWSAESALIPSLYFH